VLDRAGKDEDDDLDLGAGFGGFGEESDDGRGVL
jgi:hypothetical protein